MYRVDLNNAGMRPAVYIAKTIVAFVGAVLFAKVLAVKCFPWTMGASGILTVLLASLAYLFGLGALANGRKGVS